MRFELDNGYCVRDFQYGDASWIAHHGNNYNVARTLRDSFPHPYSLDQARAWVKHVKEYLMDTRFVIAYQNKPIGEIGLMLQDDVHRHSAELGYWLSEDHWGKGIMSQIVKRISEYAFEKFDLVRLFAEVVEYNAGSSRVLEKCGFKLEGRMSKHIYKEEEFYDQLVFGLIKSQD